MYPRLCTPSAAALHTVLTPSPSPPTLHTTSKFQANTLVYCSTDPITAATHVPPGTIYQGNSAQRQRQKERIESVSEMERVQELVRLSQAYVDEEERFTKDDLENNMVGARGVGRAESGG